jgi:hypothetical protein
MAAPRRRQDRSPTRSTISGWSGQSSSEELARGPAHADALISPGAGGSSGVVGRRRPDHRLHRCAVGSGRVSSGAPTWLCLVLLERVYGDVRETP